MKNISEYIKIIDFLISKGTNGASVKDFENVVELSTFTIRKTLEELCRINKLNKFVF